MSEHFTSKEEYAEYLEWKRSQEAPSIKAGDIVRVPRSDGSTDEGWLVKFVYPNDSGIMFAAVVNEPKGLRKELSLEELSRFNS